jgi:hypothetical protein
MVAAAARPRFILTASTTSVVGGEGAGGLGRCRCYAGDDDCLAVRLGIRSTNEYHTV